MDERVGDWTQTYSGRAFWPLDPRPEDVCIEDIAHQLAMVCRFGGAVRTFYSVAEHCVRVSLACDAADARWGLLHDASEAYAGDMVRPLKLLMPDYKAAETRIQRAVCTRFGLSAHEPDSVKRADSQLLFTEARDLMAHPPNKWKQRADPLPERIDPWTWQKAETRFLARFAELWTTNERG